MSKRFIAVDLAKVYSTPAKEEGRKLITMLAWGDEVELVEEAEKHLHIRLKHFIKLEDGSLKPEFTDGYITPSSSSKIKINEVLTADGKSDVLKVDFVDVQQGDGSVIETPSGKVILIDGGDNQLFARYLAGRYLGSTEKKPKKVDCIVVTHGDADHFSGLTELYKSEDLTNGYKRIFIKPERVYHNGIIKRPSKINKVATKETELLGGTGTDAQGNLYVTQLINDLTKIPDQELNQPFKEWKEALSHYKKRNADIEVKRLDNKSNPDKPFDFVDKKIKIEVLGPIISSVNGKPALKFLNEPPKMVGTKQLKKEGTSKTKSSYSASHTINGHSVILKLTYGNARFLFCGDLNEEAENILVNEVKNGESVLKSEILKVPHHGSADFSSDFLAAVNPLVSVVSSGDESEVKEYIHPRATLMGALGKHSRVDRPLIFVTELVAFFKREGWARVTEKAPKNAELKDLKEIYAFSRAAFGIVKVRTNGSKLLVYTNSGQDDLKEAYAFELKGEEVERLDVRSA